MITQTDMRRTRAERPERAQTALICVDVQHDFLPGGALGVEEGDAVIAELEKLAAEADIVVASRDWHPEDHVSFASVSDQGMWPDHCVAGTPGADLHPRIKSISDFVVDKATQSDRDAYSAFDGTGLGEVLRARGVRRVIVGGLATDYCVKETALSAVREGFEVEVAPEAARAVADHSGALAEMAAAGARVREEQ